MLPSGATRTSFGSFQVSGRIAGRARRAQGHEYFALWAELDRSVSLACGVGELLEFIGARGTSISYPWVAAPVDSHAVRPDEHPSPKALHNLAVRIELDDGVHVGAGARVGPTTVPCPDVFPVGVDVDRADRPPFSAIRQRPPVPYRLVRVGKMVNWLDLRLFWRSGVTAALLRPRGPQNQHQERSPAHRGEKRKPGSDSGAFVACLGHRNIPCVIHDRYSDPVYQAEHG